MIKYYGDLWNAGRPTIEAAARSIMAKRGYQVARVLPLGSGLWVGVVLTNGDRITVMDQEIRREVWAQ